MFIKAPSIFLKPEIRFTFSLYRVGFSVITVSRDPEVEIHPLFTRITTIYASIFLTPQMLIFPTPSRSSDVSIVNYLSKEKRTFYSCLVIKSQVLIGWLRKGKPSHQKVRIIGFSIQTDLKRRIFFNLRGAKMAIKVFKSKFCSWYT